MRRPTSTRAAAERTLVNNNRRISLIASFHLIPPQKKSYWGVWSQSQVSFTAKRIFHEISVVSRKKEKRKEIQCSRFVLDKELRLVARRSRAAPGKVEHTRITCCSVPHNV
jgi:hypothetical protein